MLQVLKQAALARLAQVEIAAPAVPLSTFDKHDRLIINVGTAAEPSYRVGVVQQIVPSKDSVRVAYEDLTKSVVPIDQSGVGVVGFYKQKGTKWTKHLKPMSKDKALKVLDTSKWYSASLK